MLFRILIFISSACFIFTNPNDVGSQWRGPARNGIYPEKGLKKNWPENGPQMLWCFQGLGEGHGSVGIAGDKILILGMNQMIGTLYALSFQGKLIWKKEYGLEWYKNYPGPRSTPTVAGDHVYFESGQGVVYCFNAKTGDKIWSVDLLKKFDASNISWGMAESILIEGEYLFCTPGGKMNNVVALNRFTGETIWTSTGNKQPSAYCSPLLVNHNNTQLVVTRTAESLIGVDAKTGQCYWTVPQFQMNKIHANTPVYEGGKIISPGDIPSGMIAINLSADGKRAGVSWQNENIANVMCGVIVTDGFIYSSLRWRNSWCCADATTGSIIYTSDKLDAGNIIMADDLFYIYTERGEMALVSANPQSFNVISKFRMPYGSGPHWSHPVIYQGILYIRHGSALMAFNIKG
jgi:outer membrane protein assembly factor BamB